MLSWLRSTIEADKAAAHAAAQAERTVQRDTSPEVRAATGRYSENASIPDGGAWAVEDHGYARSVISTSAEQVGVVAGSCGCCCPNADGRDVDLAHIAIHDPRDTIARSEAELALLDQIDIYTSQAEAASADASEDSPNPLVSVFVFNLGALIGAARLLAGGYRHREGFDPDWLTG